MTSNLGHIQVSDRGIALNTATGETFRLVGPALQLVHLLKRGSGAEGLLDYLVKTYDIDPTTAQRDLDAFLATLEKMNWMERTS
jgi:hypothetical protein